jgi:hypothetical protein
MVTGTSCTQFVRRCSWLQFWWHSFFSKYSELFHTSRRSVTATVSKRCQNLNSSHLRWLCCLTILYIAIRHFASPSRGQGNGPSVDRSGSIYPGRLQSSSTVPWSIMQFAIINFGKSIILYSVTVLDQVYFILRSFVQYQFRFQFF